MIYGKDGRVYQKEVLPNGVRVVTHNIKSRDSVAIGIWLAVGGRYEADPVRGAAHFLEHIVFKGSKKYSCKQIKQSIEGVGGLLNAFTAQEQTCFFAKIPSQHLQTTFDVLADMVFHPRINRGDVEREKGVILEEIKMYHDLPQYHVLELLEGLLWPDHPLGKNLAGDSRTVMKMRRADLKAFHEKFYVPANIVVAACGNLNHRNIVDLVRNKLRGLKSADVTPFVPFDNPSATERVQIVQKKIEQMHLAIGMYGYDENHQDKYALNLLSVILGGNMSSRLFNEVREKRGLAYSISSSVKALHDTGVLVVRAGVDNRQSVSAVDCILKELEKLTRRQIPDSEFIRGKEFLLGQLLLGLEDTMDHMLWIGESVTARDEWKTLKSVIKEFNKITPGDLKRVAKDVLAYSNLKLSMVGPLTSKDSMRIKKLLSSK